MKGSGTIETSGSKKASSILTTTEIEQAEAFQAARRAHSAVESAINALEVHGLDRCPDHGLDGFKRYVSLAVVGRNIQILGAILRKQEQSQEFAPPDRLAA